MDSASVTADGNTLSSSTIVLGSATTPDIDSLGFTIDNDYSGTFNLYLDITGTTSARFASSGLQIEVTVNPTSDAPTFASGVVSGNEGDPFVDVTGLIAPVETDGDGSESLYVFIEKDPTVQSFVDATNGSQIGTDVSNFDFGDGSLVTAVRLNETEFSTLGLVFEENFKTTSGAELVLKTKAGSLDTGLDENNLSDYAFYTDSDTTLTVTVNPIVDTITTSVDQSGLASGFEDTNIVLPITLTQVDADETPYLYIGNFRDSSGASLNVNKVDGFRPSVTDLASVGLISPEGDGVLYYQITQSTYASLVGDGTEFNLEIIPETDYAGSVIFDIYSVTEEPTDTISASRFSSSNVVTVSSDLAPRSEIPDVSASNLSLNEDTDASGSYSGVDLTNISVSLSDTSSLSNVTVTLSAVDSVGSALSGFTLEGTSTVSTGSYDSGTLTLTVSGTPVGVDLLADLDTLLGDVTLRPPEDFSGDATITVGVTATEQGAEPSQQTTADFTASVAAVAESPVFAAGSIIAQENSSEVGSLLEDQDIYLELPAAATILQDLDGSETLSQVRIGGLNDIGGLGLVGSLVDETGASIGTSDGAGTTTLTAAQYAGEVYFRPPTDYNGTVDLTVVAVSQEPSSGSTATSDTYALNFSLDPVSEEPDVSASNLSLNEDTDASGSYSGVDLTNISVSLSDTSSLSNVTVTLSAVDSVGSALSGFTLEGTSTVSTGSYDSGTLTLTVSGTPVGVDLLADLDTLLGDVTLRPPEDFSGDATITVGVTATEQGAEPSQQTTADFTASVAAVAESPVFAEVLL